MANVNKVILVGNLGSDPDIRTIGNGKVVLNFSVATSEEWKDLTGHKQKKVEWHQITAWGKLAETMGQMLSKGSKVYIEGPLKTDSYEQNGEKKYKTYVNAKIIQFIDSKSKDIEMLPKPASMDFGAEPSFDQHPELPF